MSELLFLAHRLPFPPDKGERIRAFHMLRALVAAGWGVRLGCLVDGEGEAARLPALEAALRDALEGRADADGREGGCAGAGGDGRADGGANGGALLELCAVPVGGRRLLATLLGARPGLPLTMPYFDHPRLRRWVRGVLACGEVRAVLAYSSAMAPYVLSPPGAAPAPGPVRVLDMVDVDSEKWAAYAAAARGPLRLPQRLLWAREARTLLRQERALAARFDRTLLVTPQECARLAELAPEVAGRLEALENGVDTAHFSPAHRLPPVPGEDGALLVVFTGSMGYRPNVDAVGWFAREVLPALRARHPALRFAVVGADPAPAVRRLAALPGVVVTGRVPDARPWIARADLVVAPLRIARGVQNKVLEAMAMARPVLATTAAFEGVRAEPGHDLLLADDAAGLAAQALSVLAGAHPGLGVRARAAVERGHAWSRTTAGLDPLLRGLPARAA